MSTDKCLGCGCILQYDDPDQPGYATRKGMEYCRRCFRMMHYDAHNAHDYIPDNIETLVSLGELKGHYVWIIDVFDLDSSLNCGLVDFYREHECTVILNKFDLLPDKISYEHVTGYVLQRLKSTGIRYRSVLTRGINDDFREVFNAHVPTDDAVIFTGVANVGKSTIINALLGRHVVTVNPYPATTIALNEIRTEEYHFIDSAGLWLESSMISHITSKDLKKAVPVTTVRPRIFQMDSDQSLALGGLVRFDVSGCDKYTVVFYGSRLLEVHRCALEKAENYWNRHYGEQAVPVCKDIESAKGFKRVHFNHRGKADYLISGLGWFTVSADKADVDVWLNLSVHVIKRKAMI